jgi:pimeloyl-ACP methyl ester carboxylesterase
MLAVPPAQITPAPSATREVAFPGFNQFPLQGTVEAAQGSPVFAVLVADSGPLDRDWRGPKLPGHGGRALAAWLQDCGIGSLRVDKRLFGAKDRQLDVSLDAQLGDLKAAMAFVGTLPEARGRRILLVGHGEGALLALLAARGADALLLMAMPGKSMAMTIKDQITPQLPAEKAAQNLVYLEAIFNAIRQAEPAPRPGPEVYPTLARFCGSLMAPETLEFVKATLDLDPWAMLARNVMPVALVWGDRDVQTWKPATVPDTFHGAVFEIPGANHLFRQEPRTKAELDPASALSGYGDDTPLADLTPVATWLKGLFR